MSDWMHFLRNWNGRVWPWKPSRNVGVLTLLTLMASCVTTGSVETSACTVFRPIYWASTDTAETVDQVKDHNAKWQGYCRGT